MALSRSASSRMIVGPFPPSSRRMGLAPARCATALPTAELPVNPTACVPGFATISSPTSASPKSRLTEPSGMPASRKHSINRTAMMDEVGAGFHTTVLPAARAADRYSLGMATGKFHGVAVELGGEDDLLAGFAVGLPLF